MMKKLICILNVVIIIVLVACGNLSEIEEAACIDADGAPSSDDGKLALVVANRINNNCQRMENFGGAYYEYYEDRFVCIVRLKDPENKEDRRKILDVTEHDDIVVFEESRYSIDYLRGLRNEITKEIDSSGMGANFFVAEVSNKDKYVTVKCYIQQDDILDIIQKITLLDTQGNGDALNIIFCPKNREIGGYNGNYLTKLANEIIVDIFMQEAVSGKFFVSPWPETGRVKVFYEQNINSDLHDKIVACDTQGDGDAIIWGEYNESTFSDFSPEYLISLWEDVYCYLEKNSNNVGVYFCFVLPEPGRVVVLYDSKHAQDLPNKIIPLDTEGGGRAILFQHYNGEIIDNYLDENLGTDNSGLHQ